MWWLVFILFPVNAEALDDKRERALKTAATAALKQSGLEADFLKVQHTLESKASKWLRDNGLGGVATVGGVLIPILYYKTIRASTGDFTTEVKPDKVQVTWQIQF